MSSGPALLVTGSHRSGTTWAGQMLCASGEAGYIHEPLHPWHPQSWMRRRVDRLYPYLTSADGRYRDEFARILSFRYPTFARLREARSARDVKAALALARRAADHRRHARRPLVKDPMALFAAPWLAAEFGVLPVVFVRHPLAVINSALGRDWIVEPETWLDDPALCRDLLGPWVDEIRAVAGRDVVERAALAWKVMYGVTARFADEHPEWPVLVYEDVVAEPIVQFETLYRRVGFTFTTEAAEAIGRLSQHSETRRRSRLTSEQTKRVREIVDGVSHHFYGEHTWAGAS